MLLHSGNICIKVMNNWKAYLAVIVAMLIWSTSGIATKIALQVFTPLTLVTLRFTLAVVVMLVVGLASHKLNKIEKKDVPLFLLTAFVQSFLYYVCETYGMRLISSPTVAEVLLSTSPLFAPLLAFVLIREKVTLNNIIGIVLSTIGVVMMVLIGSDNFSIGSPWGVVLCFAAVMSAVLYTICLRKIPAQYNNLSIVFYSQLFGLLFFYPTWAIIDLPRLQIVSFSEMAIPSLAIVYLAVFSSVVAYVLFSYTVREIGVTRGNAFNNIRPVFTAVIMMLAFDEQMPIVKWIAMLLVMIGLFICQYQPKKEMINK